MAFPQIEQTFDNGDLAAPSASTTWTLSMPATVAAGSRFIAFVGGHDTAGAAVTLAGSVSGSWSLEKTYKQSSVQEMAVFTYGPAAGNEGSETLTATYANAGIGSILVARVSGWTGRMMVGDTDAAAWTNVVDTPTASNLAAPDSDVATWGAKDNLYIGMCGLTDDGEFPDVWPYTDNQTYATVGLAAGGGDNNSSTISFCTQEKAISQDVGPGNWSPNSTAAMMVATLTLEPEPDAGTAPVVEEATTAENYAAGGDIGSITVDAPVTTQAGDLLLILANGNNRGTAWTGITDASGGTWTEIVQSAGASEGFARGVLYAKTANGSEATLTVNAALSNHFTVEALCWRVTGAEGPSAVFAGATGGDILDNASSASATPWSKSVTPSPGADDYLWGSFVGFTTPAARTASAFAWADNQTLLQAVSGGTTSGILVSTENSNAASNDPTTVGNTLNATVNWNSFTFAVQAASGGGSDTLSVQTAPNPGYLFGQVATNDTGNSGIFDNDTDVDPGDDYYGVWAPTDPTDITQAAKGVFNGITLPSTFTYRVYDVSLGQWSNSSIESFSETGTPPQLLAPIPDQNATVGQAITPLDMDTYFSGATSYSEDQLPAGITLVGSTISGTPTTEGGSSTTITATNATGNTPDSFNWTVSAAIAPTLLSATAAADGNSITLVFSEPLDVGAGGNGGFSGTASNGSFSLTYSSGDGLDTYVYTTGRTIEQGEVGTISYVQPGDGLENSANTDLESFSNVPFTNNSTADTTPPTVSSAVINTQEQTITFSMSEPVTFGAGGNGGFTVDLSGGAAVLTYASGDTSSALVYNINRAVAANETGTFDYTQPGNGVEDIAGNDLASIVDGAVSIGAQQQHNRPDQLHKTSTFEHNVQTYIHNTIDFQHKR